MKQAPGTVGYWDCRCTNRLLEITSQLLRAVLTDPPCLLTKPAPANVIPTRLPTPFRWRSATSTPQTATAPALSAGAAAGPHRQPLLVVPHPGPQVCTRGVARGEPCVPAHMLSAPLSLHARTNLSTTAKGTLYRMPERCAESSRCFAPRVPDSTTCHCGSCQIEYGM